MRIGRILIVWLVAPNCVMIALLYRKKFNKKVNSASMDKKEWLGTSVYRGLVPLDQCTQPTRSGHKPPPSQHPNFGWSQKVVRVVKDWTLHQLTFRVVEIWQARKFFDHFRRVAFFENTCPPKLIEKIYEPDA
jgi:hypothetical protein